MVYCIRTLYTTLYTTLQVVLSLRHLYYDTTKTIVREKGNIFVRHVLRFSDHVLVSVCSVMVYDINKIFLRFDICRAPFGVCSNKKRCSYLLQRGHGFRLVGTVARDPR